MSLTIPSEIHLVLTAGQCPGRSVQQRGYQQSVRRNRQAISRGNQHLVSLLTDVNQAEAPNTADEGDDRVNNAGIAGEGSREGYEATPTDDAEKFKAQLWKSEFDEWSDIYRTNVIAYYVSVTICHDNDEQVLTPDRDLVVHLRRLPPFAQQSRKVDQGIRLADHQRFFHFWYTEIRFWRAIRLHWQQGRDCSGRSGSQ